MLNKRGECGLVPVTLFVRMVVALCGGALSACAATPGYQGPVRGAAEVAVVSASLPITAGAPVTVQLRKVDDTVIPFGVWRVELLPGKHELLVDCSTRNPARTSRHRLPVEVEAGGRYHLVPVAGTPQEGCTTVTLE